MRSGSRGCLPGLAVALFHGEIRVAHAFGRSTPPTPSRADSELARSLGYWAARFRPGRADRRDPGDDVTQAVLASASGMRPQIPGDPDIFNLHGVTGAMALEMLAPHLTDDWVGLRPRTTSRRPCRTLRGCGRDRRRGARSSSRRTDLARAAAASGDPHQVKLVEACRRGFDATGDPAFAAAARSRDRARLIHAQP